MLAEIAKMNDKDRTAEIFFLKSEFSSLRWTRIRVVRLRGRSNLAKLTVLIGKLLLHRTVAFTVTKPTRLHDNVGPPSTPQEESPQIDQEPHCFFDGFDSVSTRILL